MTRGKHGTQAARRRAESAEEQLDRLMPKLVDTERLLQRYRSEAEAAPILRRELSQLRGVIGVPRAEHQAMLDEIAAERRERDKVLAENLVMIFTQLANFKALGRPPGDETEINAKLVAALRAIPRAAALKLLELLGWERDIRRGLLEDGMANRISAGAHDEALTLYAEARSMGLQGVPQSWLGTGVPPSIDRILADHEPGESDRVGGTPSD